MPPPALSRRRFLALSAAAAALPLAGCGFVPQDDGSDDPDTLTFTTWGTDAELAGLRSTIDGFEKANPGRSVRLNAVPYDQMFPNLDAQIQAGNAPDIFRVPYYTLGAYAGRGQLLDLADHLPADFGDRFTAPAWAAVRSRGRPVGVPHHTDTSVVLYNKKLLADAGVRSVPSRPEDAWTWDEFAAVAAQMRRKLPGGTYPFVVNWQGNGVTRWLSWLWQAGGRLLTDSLDEPAVDSAAARAALGFTRRFFTERWVPPSTSVQSNTLAQDVWFSQTTAMTWAGAFLLPDADSTASFDWGATFPPRRQRAASDFGGNALVATSGTRKPALAAAFLEFATRRDEMRTFCRGASLLPTRRDLTGDDGLRFEVRPELTRVFLDQAATVRPADVAQVASPGMSRIIPVLQDRLEDAFVGDAGTAATVSGLAADIRSALTR